MGLGDCLLWGLGTSCQTIGDIMVGWTFDAVVVISFLPLIFNSLIIFIICRGKHISKVQLHLIFLAISDIITVNINIYGAIFGGAVEKRSTDTTNSKTIVTHPLIYSFGHLFVACSITDCLLCTYVFKDLRPFGA